MSGNGNNSWSSLTMTFSLRSRNAGAIREDSGNTSGALEFCFIARSEAPGQGLTGQGYLKSSPLVRTYMKRKRCIPWSGWKSREMLQWFLLLAHSRNIT